MPLVNYLPLDIIFFTMAADFGAILLKNQLKELSKNPIDGFSVGLADDSDIYSWQIIIEGPPGTLLYVSDIHI